jgi:beta-glucosidase
MKGRTYRYFDQPLYAFGHGLSYTTFALDNEKWNIAPDGSGTLTIDVNNTGKRDGAEVVQLYIRNMADAEGPTKSLRAFQRIEVKAGQKATATLTLTPKSFEFFDTETNTMRVKPGQYELFYGTSSQAKDLKKKIINIQ